jgi:hypothetical protein
MNVNLENDWLRFDNVTSNTASWYGYNTNPGALDTDLTWSIREISGSGSTYVYWNNNISLAYEASWANRSYYFATPSNISISATSVPNGLGSYNVTFTWNAATGSSRYYANFTRDGITIYNMLDGGIAIQNPYQTTSTKTYINTYSATINNCPSGHTYSASLYAANGFGNSSTVTASVKI